MVFLAGPRQAGKTTLSKQIAKEFNSSLYLTYDRFADREIILKESWLPSIELLILDEDVDAKRWRLQYVESLLNIDVLDFETIHNLKTMRLIFELLHERVGSPISYSSIFGDVALSPTTVKKYIQILEALYIVFRVTPFSNNIARSLLKEPKIYFFDTALVKGESGGKFENFVATYLLKNIFAKVDALGENYSLNYLLTKEKKEVDFAIIRDDQIQSIIEVKVSDDQISSGLRYFQEKYDIKGILLVKDLKRERIEKSIEIRDADKYFKNLIPWKPFSFYPNASK